MSRLEWLVVAAMLVIAFAVTFTHLDGTQIGRWMAGEPLAPATRSADSQLFYAVPLVALLIWWSAALFPRHREFLRTGAGVLLVGGVLYALYLLSSG